MRRLLILLFSILLLIAVLGCGLPEMQRLIASITRVTPTTPATESPTPPNELDCPGNLLLNGGFEQGDQGWSYAGTEHGQAIRTLPLLQGAQNVHGGETAASLGGYETASDSLTQSFVVPENGQLSLWWIYRSPDPIKDRDYMAGRLVLPNNEDGLPIFYAGGEAPQGSWQQTILNLGEYAGQRVTLEFSTSNDNYYASWMAIDDICVESLP